MNEHDGIYFDGRAWRVKRLGRAHGRKRVGGAFGSYAAALQAREEVIMQQRSTYTFRDDAPLVDIEDEPDIPANANLIAVRPLTLHLSRWLYASDLHVPLHHRDYIRRLLRVARKTGISDLIIGGDMLDFDSVSAHPKTTQQSSLNETLRVAGDLIAALCSVFNRVYILPGNHCQRVTKRLGEPLDFDMLIHAALKGRCVEQVVTTNYDYIYINDNWAVGHPRYFEGAGAAGLSKAAIREGRHIIGAHTHALSLSYTLDGKHLVIYPGHMSDPNITPYVMQSRGLSKYAEWRNGFVMIENDIVTLLSDGLVDWKKYGG